MTQYDYNLTDKSNIKFDASSRLLVQIIHKIVFSLSIILHDFSAGNSESRLKMKCVMIHDR
jgi:hypothetical protein